MITLTETHTSAPHHCQECGIRIHAVTTGRSTNKNCSYHISRKSPAVTNHEDITSLLQTPWWLIPNIFLLQLLGNVFTVKSRSGCEKKLPEIKQCMSYELSNAVWLCKRWRLKPGKTEPTLQVSKLWLMQQTAIISTESCPLNLFQSHICQESNPRKNTTLFIFLLLLFLFLLLKMPNIHWLRWVFA